MLIIYIIVILLIVIIVWSSLRWNGKDTMITKQTPQTVTISMVGSDNQRYNFLVGNDSSVKLSPKSSTAFNINNLQNGIVTKITSNTGCFAYSTPKNAYMSAGCVDPDSSWLLSSTTEPHGYTLTSVGTNLFLVAQPITIGSNTFYNFGLSSIPTTFYIA